MGQVHTLSIQVLTYSLPLDTVDCTVWRAAPQTTHHQQHSSRTEVVSRDRTPDCISVLCSFFTYFKLDAPTGLQTLQKRTAESKLLPTAKKTADRRRPKNEDGESLKNR